MRVLQLTNMYPDAARPYWGTFVQQQIDSLTQLGVESTIRLVDGETSRWNYVTSALTVQRMSRQDRFDLVHAHYGLTGFIASTQTSLPLVVSLYGSDVHVPWQRAFSILAALRARRTIVCSERMARKLPRRIRPVIAPPGIDSAHFYARDRDEARARFGYRPDQRVLLFPANPERRVKDYPLFRAAVRRLRRDDVRIATLGAVPEDDLPFFYTAMDCLVLTSKNEGSPTVIKEALACGCPVVAVDVGDVAEQLREFPLCHVTRTRRPAEIAARITDVLDAGHRIDPVRAADTFSSEAVAQQVLTIYEKALDPR
jgi:glycosyltransferase involved in cell wall biosynthesis